jgi:hypothetical protein
MPDHQVHAFVLRHVDAQSCTSGLDIGTMNANHEIQERKASTEERNLVIHASATLIELNR